MKTIIAIFLAMTSTFCYYSYGCGSYQPVCGTNGVTYSNACACQEASVEIAYYTSCNTYKTYSYSQPSYYSYSSPSYSYYNDCNYGFGCNNNYYNYGGYYTPMSYVGSSA